MAAEKEAKEADKVINKKLKRSLRKTQKRKKYIKLQAAVV